MKNHKFPKPTVRDLTSHTPGICKWCGDPAISPERCSCQSCIDEQREGWNNMMDGNVDGQPSE